MTPGQHSCPLPRCVRLTLQKPQPKSNGKVSSPTPNLYDQWRALAQAAPAMREAEEAAPSERLLQRIWQHQRLQRDQLKTLDGRRVRVLHPGFWNHEAGPDFRGAIVQFACEPPRSGDVEIDLHPAGWRGHGHDRNPAYQNVVLHVVWNADSKAPCSLPTLALRSLLDLPLNELSLWFSHDTGAPGLLAGQCSAPWRDREQFADFILPRELWRFNGLRPANHPQRRLALAAHWLAAGSLPHKLELWFTANIHDNNLQESLREVLQAKHDDFWSRHWTFRSARRPKPQPLLGAQRVTDLAVNVLLPWFWTRAVAGDNEALRRTAEHRYIAWPKSEDNAVLRLARR